MRATGEEERAPAGAGVRGGPPRPAVHVASGSRLGDPHPRQEGPTDLRLVPPALAAWATAALTVHASPGWVTGVAVLCAVVGVALLAWQGQGQGQGWARGQAQGLGCRRGRGGVAWTKVSVAAVLLCAGAAAASAGLHGADLRRGPVPGLAEGYARVTAEVELTSDPRLTRPRIQGNRAAPAAVLLQAEVRRVRSPDGSVADTRTPVLVVVDVEAGAGRAAWLSLLPSTRVRVAAQAVPAMAGGDRVAGVLRVRGGGAPAVVEEASAVQRVAGRLRAGLREATDGLDADARALLPGFVVGDTSRVPAELDEAFKATDLTHLLAVSGANIVQRGG